MADKITFGFEIEGVFDRQLHAEFIADEAKGEFKFDGSVDYERIKRAHNLESDKLLKSQYCDLSSPRCEFVDGRCILHNNGNFYSEYASMVYGSLDKMLADIAKFKTNKTHWFDASCGLHICIGADYKIQNLLANYGFMKSLQDTEFCKCIKERLSAHTTYCHLYKSRQAILQCFKTKDKFRFMRFHPDKYCEFRFLTPCEHKVDNVRKLASLVGDYLVSDIRKVKKVERDSAVSEFIKINLTTAKRFERIKL